MSDKTEIKWLAEPEEHDYPAAESYLNLIYDPQMAAGYAQQLKQAPMSQFKAKDIFRASGLSWWVSAILTWKRTARKFWLALRSRHCCWSGTNLTARS